MSLFRNMDLYKVIVLASFVVLPLGGWWCYRLDEQIAASKKSIQEATKSGGILEQIGSLQKKVEIVAQNRRVTTDTITQHRTYFEGQIIAAGGASLKTTDFKIEDPKEEIVTMPATKQRVTDHVVDVTWLRRELFVPLEFIYAVLFNCESGASSSDTANRHSVWKLRELELVNATDDGLLRSQKTPPAELNDKWMIRSMKFARREPRKAGQ